MTKRREVLDALIEMLTSIAPPYVIVEGLDGSDAAPDRLTTGGRVLIEAGNPGVPEIDLSPPMYNYRHEIPITVDALPIAASGMRAEDVIDEILGAISAAIEADRFLGGVVDYLDGYAPQTEDDYVDGAAVSRVAPFTIIALYSTPHPF